MTNIITTAMFVYEFSKNKVILRTLEILSSQFNCAYGITFSNLLYALE